MNRETLVSLIKGYENQLLNETDPKKINWIKDQINYGHYLLSTQSIYS